MKINTISFLFFKRNNFCVYIQSVIPVEEQLRYFKEYKARIAVAIGNEKAQTLISKAVFVISCGTNDFVVNYFSTPFRRYSFTVSDYQNFLLVNFQLLIQVRVYIYKLISFLRITK